MTTKNVILKNGRNYKPYVSVTFTDFDTTNPKKSGYWASRIEADMKFDNCLKRGITQYSWRKDC